MFSNEDAQPSLNRGTARIVHNWVHLWMYKFPLELTAKLNDGTIY